jgi:hypothetical protein
VSPRPAHAAPPARRSEPMFDQFWEQVALGALLGMVFFWPIAWALQWAVSLLPWFRTPSREAPDHD